jgi:GTP diphosphokinase / guanosine-3',5'-bis(diphosphate) 3'-diphosphatase
VHVAQPPPRTVAAVDFAIDAYTGVKVRPGKGLPHAEAVADILRADGADESTQVAALLHDVVEDTKLTVEDVRATFGDRVARMVAALSEDDSIKRYATRKRALRSQIVAAEPATTDIALADKIASLRHSAITGAHISARKLSHYRATLRLGRASGASTRLVAQLERLLDPV